MHVMGRVAFCTCAALLVSLFPAGTAVGQAETTSETRGKLISENPPIRVLLVDSVTSLCLVPKHVWQARSLDGKELCELKADVPTTITLTDGNLLMASAGSTSAKPLGTDAIALESASEHGRIGILKVPFGVGWWWESAEDRVYEGRIEIRAGAAGKLVVTAILPLEDYLRGVVPSEIGADSPLEAMCAQAVAARSAAALALTSKIYAGSHHDICSDVACQAFSGVSKCTAVSDCAVTSTRGYVLMFDGRPLSAYYASNCGGYSEDIRNVWPERADDRGYWNAACFDGAGKCAYDLTTEEGVRKWLDDSPDVYCNPSRNNVPKWASKYFRWTREITADELTSRVAAKKDIGRVHDIRPVKRGPSGRLIEAEFVGEKGTWKTSPELAIRQVFDPPLKSSVIVVDAKGPKEKPEAFVIKGAGWGHGVGMCQTGAVSMANKGKDFREILKHYYPNASVEKVY